jgi:hypothetical protein
LAVGNFTYVWLDGDGDGIHDTEDNCPSIANPTQHNSDGDSFGDACDNCIYDDNESQFNSDSDSLGDACDNCPSDDNDDQVDFDTDGVGDVCDNCPEISNPGQIDNDNDQVGNSCDNCPDDYNEDQTDFDGDSVGYICDNCPIYANPGQEDANLDGIGDACTFVESTPQGSNVSVTLDANVEVTFEQVITSGNTELTEVTYGEDISGFSIWPSNPTIYYNITTDAVYSGLIEICITYDDTGMDPFVEELIALMHFDGVIWIDITSSHDMENNVICGSTTDLSPFVMAYPEGTYLCGDADGSSDVDIDDVVYLIQYIFAGGPAPDPLASGDADCAGGIDIDDVVYLINYIFQGGSAPCDPDGDEVADC